jgi:hypothetical protein
MESRMKRTWLGLVPLALVSLTLTACPKGGGTDDGGTETDGGTSDLRKTDAGACKADPLPAVDFAVAPTGQMVKPGDIGTACTQNMDCKQGKTPVCWKQTLFDASGLLPTPGGYCSSVCDADADCGTDHLCLDFGARGKACIAGCGDAVTCRHPGYSCAYLDQEGNNIITGCWPNDNLTCNPKEDTCTDPRYGMPGGCYRQAIEDEGGGICLQTCVAGDFCDPNIFDDPLQCLYIDFTDGGDAFRGTICFPSSDMPKDPGATCMYSNECQDGYQCDNRMTGGSKKCEKICNLNGRSPRCTGGQTCQKIFPGCEAGLCKAD